MLGTRELSSPDFRLDVIMEELANNNQDLKAVEQALELNAQNHFLLKKYERLSKREELLLEERKLWAGAALQNHSWQAGLLAAPGVKEKQSLENLRAQHNFSVLNACRRLSAPGAEAGEVLGVQRAVAEANIVQPLPLEPHTARRKYNTRNASQLSPDKAQLMLLANAADASDLPESSGQRSRHHRKRKLSSAYPSGSPPSLHRRTSRQAFGTRFKPFHVAKTAPDQSEKSEEGSPPVNVPVTLSFEDRLADYARRILEGPVTTARSDMPSLSTEVAVSDNSREGSDGRPASLHIEHSQQAAAAPRTEAEELVEGGSEAAAASPVAIAEQGTVADTQKHAAEGSQPPLLPSSRGDALPAQEGAFRLSQPQESHRAANRPEPASEELQEPLREGTSSERPSLVGQQLPAVSAI